MRRDQDATRRMREALVLAHTTLADLGDRMCADIDVGTTATVRCAALVVASAMGFDLSTCDARIVSLAVANAYWALEYVIDVGFDARVPSDLALRAYDKRIFDAALDSVRDALFELESIESSESCEAAAA